MNVESAHDGSVAGNVAPLSSTERSRKRRDRLRAGREGSAPGRPFESGHQLSVTHGARSPRLTGDRAREIAAAFLRSAACPPDAAGDLLLMSSLAAWAQAEAECERYRSYADVVEAQLGDDAVAELITEETATTRSEVRPAMGTLTGKDLTRSRESLARAAHRAEMRAHTLRTALQKRLEAHGDGRKTVSLALLMEEDEAAEQAELDGTG
jgi:hypothetical protein